MGNYKSRYPWKVQYQRRDGFKFNNIFKLKDKAIDYMRDTLDDLGFDEYIIIKAVEEGYIWSRDGEGNVLEMKIIENI